MGEALRGYVTSVTRERQTDRGTARERQADRQKDRKEGR